MDYYQDQNLTFGTTAATGTTIKFASTDTVVPNATNKNTEKKLQCISATKQYEDEIQRICSAGYQAGCKRAVLKAYNWTWVKLVA